jgi:trehalose/maltose hydrolase-like predicted phosphorylase
MMLALEEHALEGDEETLVRRVAGKLYLPAPNAEGVIPQADGWLNLKEVDLSGLRGKGLAAFAGMNVQQIGSYQVCKQADVVALLTQFPHSCTRDILKANLDYYEPRCLHHSSLSYTTHCLAAARLGRTEQAYEFFRQARSVDLNDGATSLEGIHAGAMGGIWQCVVEGFGGVRAENGRVMAVPHLPKEWTKLSFTMSSGGRSYHVIQTQEGTRVTQVQQSGGEKDMQAREKLLRAAGDMLERDGYAALDVTAAAKVSDVPEEVALAYFADKAALCRGVCRDALGRLEQQLTDAIDQMCLEFRMLPELILIGPVRMILEHPRRRRGCC